MRINKLKLRMKWTRRRKEIIGQPEKLEDHEIRNTQK